MDLDKKAASENQIAIKNRKKAVSNIPKKLLTKEKNYSKNFKKFKGDKFSKLSKFHAFTDELGSYLSTGSPCKNLCSDCCNYNVAVSRVEAENISKHINIELKSYKPIKKVDYHGEPCPFLKNNSCSIYEVRPYPCRRHYIFTSDNSFCSPERSNEYIFPLVRFDELEKTQQSIVEELSDGEWRDIREWFEI